MKVRVKRSGTLAYQGINYTGGKELEVDKITDEMKSQIVTKEAKDDSSNKSKKVVDRPVQPEK